MISQNVIDEIRDRADIVEVVSSYIPLKKAGQNWRALCPFHEEKSPSFNVHPAKRIFHCFGCGVGGNVIDFVMRHENLAFPDAVRLLADRYGIEIKETSRKVDEGRDRIYKAMASASAFYHKTLMESPLGGPVWRYLEKRGVPPELVDKFAIGYAPDKWDALASKFLKEGYDLPTLETAGLAKIGSAGKPVDRFRNRLMFPIRAVGGQVIAFGGRTLDDEQGPKYLNSPETPIYRKSNVLFGLDLAQQSARRENTLIIVEGYLDVVALHKAGVENCAAVSGTAFTPRQAEMIRRVCENVVALFDSDAAGVAAAKKSAPILMDAGLRPKVATLPGAKDPDDYIAANGAEAFKQRVAAAVAFPVFVTGATLAQTDMDSVEEKTRAAREILPFIARVRDGIERDQYLQSLAAKTGIDKRALERELRKEPGAPAAPGAAAPQARPGARAMAERILARVLLDNPSYLDTVAAGLTAEDFKDEAMRKAFELILRAHQQGAPDAAGVVNLAGDEASRALITSLALEAGLYDPEDASRAASDCVHRVRYDPAERKKSLNAQARAAEGRAAEEYSRARKKYMETRRK